MNTKQTDREKTLAKVMRALHYSKMAKNKREEEAEKKYLSRNVRGEVAPAKHATSDFVELEEVFTLPGQGVNKKKSRNNSYRTSVGSSAYSEYTFKSDVRWFNTCWLFLPGKSTAYNFVPYVNRAKVWKQW